MSHRRRLALALTAELTLLQRWAAISSDRGTEAAGSERGWLIAEPLIEYRIHAGQQLGVGTSNAAQRGNSETRRQFYARVARQFEDLLKQVLAEGWSEHDGLVEKIKGKIAFLKSQAGLSQQLGMRTMQMVGLLPHYVHYARGLASMRTDLLLGREML